MSEFDTHVARACGGPCDGREDLLHHLPPPPVVAWLYHAHDDVCPETGATIPFYDGADYVYDRKVLDENRTIHLYRHRPKPSRPVIGEGIPDTIPAEWEVGRDMPPLSLEPKTAD